MSHHTPHWVHVYKLWTMVVIVVAPLVIVFPLLLVLIGSLTGVAVMLCSFAFIIRFVLWLTHSNEPAYRKLRQGRRRDALGHVSYAGHHSTRRC